jgi:hypothetical protein
MEIEQPLSWVNETLDQLEKRFSGRTEKNELDAIVFASMPMVQNYLSCTLEILEGGRKLPAMALLRCLYQLTSRIAWILMGSTQEECEERLRCFKMSALQDAAKLIDRVLTLYQQNQQGIAEVVLNALREHKATKVEIEKKIKELRAFKVAEMPHPLEILKTVYGASEKRQNHNGLPPVGEMAAILAWPRLHQAVHPDYLVLKLRIATTKGTWLYEGDDVDADIDGLKYECCLCVYRFLQEVYKCYKLENFQKIQDVFSDLTREVNEIE